MAQEHAVLEVRVDRTELISAGSFKPLADEPRQSPAPSKRPGPLLSRTAIRGVAELARPPSVSAVPNTALLRSDRSVMVQMEALKRDPAWRLEKLSEKTRDVTWRSFDTAMELLRTGLESGLTTVLVGSQRLYEAVSKAVREAWLASRAGAAKARSHEPDIEAAKLNTLARPAELRAKAHPEGMIVAHLEKGAQVIVFEGYAAPQGYVLVQTTRGEIGFLAR